MSSPSMILDAQTDLVTRMEEETFKHAIASTMVAEMYGLPEVQKLSREDKITTLEQSARHFATKMEWAVQNAYCYRVSPEMCEVIEQAADTLDETDEWHHRLAPTSCGFVRFEKPIMLGEFADEHGHAMGEGIKADYLVWGPGEPEGDMMKFRRDGHRTALFWFSDTGRVNDPLMKWFESQGHLDTVRRLQGRWMLTGWDSYLDGRSLGPSRIESQSSTWGEGSAGARVALQLGGEVLTAQPEFTKQRNDARLVHALWMVLQMPMVKLNPESADRPARRRAARKRLPGHVTTIMLRRQEYLGDRPDYPEGGREYLHQWVVRWHWRWQPYGSRKQRGFHTHGIGEAPPGGHVLSSPIVIDHEVVKMCETHECDYYVKRILIDSYIKGPPGKPLINPTKIMILER